MMESGYEGTTPTLENLDESKIKRVVGDWALHFTIGETGYLLHTSSEDGQFMELYEKVQDNHKGSFNLRPIDSRYMNTLDGVLFFIKMYGNRVEYGKNIIYSHVDRKFFVLQLALHRFIRVSDRVSKEIGLNKLLNDIEEMERKVESKKNELSILESQLQSLRGW